MNFRSSEPAVAQASDTLSVPSSEFRPFAQASAKRTPSEPQASAKRAPSEQESDFRHLVRSSEIPVAQAKAAQNL